MASKYQINVPIYTTFTMVRASSARTHHYYLDSEKNTHFEVHSMGQLFSQQGVLSKKVCSVINQFITVSMYSECLVKI